MPTGTINQGVVANVKAFGAVGNNIADDTAAIQAAIDAIGAEGVVFFPEGTYKITAALNVGESTAFSHEIRGAYAPYGGADGVLGTTINQTTLGAKIFNVTQTSGQGNSLYIRDIKLQHSTDATAGGHAVFTAPSGGWTTGVTLENVQIQNSDIGVVVDHIVQPIFRNVSFLNTQTCAVDLVGEVNLPTFENCYFQAGDGDGLRSSGLIYDLRMDSCVFESNAGADIRIAVGGNILEMALDSCWFEFTSTAGMIKIDGLNSGLSGADWTFTGCHFDGSNQVGGRDIINNTQALGSNGIVQGVTFIGCGFYGLNGGKILKVAQTIQTGSADPGYFSVAFINCRGSAGASSIAGVHVPATGGSSVLFAGNNGPRSDDLAASYGGFIPNYIDLNTTVTNLSRAIKANGWWQGSVVATASLPAAAASLDGSILIEDAGAGDRNLIIYAGGQRFRIDGGASF